MLFSVSYYFSPCLFHSASLSLGRLQQQTAGGLVVSNGETLRSEGLVPSQRDRTTLRVITGTWALPRLFFSPLKFLPFLHPNPASSALRAACFCVILVPWPSSSFYKINQFTETEKNACLYFNKRKLHMELLKHMTSIRLRNECLVDNALIIDKAASHLTLKG